MISRLDKPVVKLVEVQDIAHQKILSSRIVYDRQNGRKSLGDNTTEVQLGDGLTRNPLSQLVGEQFHHVGVELAPLCGQLQANKSTLDLHLYLS